MGLIVSIYATLCSVIRASDSNRPGASASAIITAEADQIGKSPAEHTIGSKQQGPIPRQEAISRQGQKKHNPRQSWASAGWPNRCRCSVSSADCAAQVGLPVSYDRGNCP